MRKRRPETYIEVPAPDGLRWLRWERSRDGNRRFAIAVAAVVLAAGITAAALLLVLPS